MSKRNRPKKNHPSAKRAAGSQRLPTNAKKAGTQPGTQAVASALRASPGRFINGTSKGKLPSLLRSPWGWGIAAVVIAAIGIGAGWWLVQNRRPAPAASGATTTEPGATASTGTPTDASTSPPTNASTDTPTAGSPGATEAKTKGSAALTPPTAAQIEATRKAGTISYEIQTSRGSIALELRGDLMPLTVANFVQLAQAGFYDGLTFHRVEDWVVQGGDPAGDGSGGPGYTIRLETNPALLNRAGAIAMARSQDPDSAGSQFYILKKDANWLDGSYAVFGKVTAGMDVVNKLQVGDKILSVRPAAAPSTTAASTK